MIRVVNVKKDFPTVDYAFYLIDQEIKCAKALGCHAIVVIHGYGSSGKGGVIKQEIKTGPSIKEISFSSNSEKNVLISFSSFLSFFKFHKA